MKELIYLDTSFLHSFIAQSQGGLPTSTSHERQEQATHTNQKTTGKSDKSFTQFEADTGSLSIPGLIKSPSGRLRVRIQPGKNSSESISLSELESGKEIISKQLHDNALETFEQYLSEEKQLFNISEENLEGKFIKTVSSFKIIDFQYLRKIIQTDTLIRFMFMNQDEEIQSVKEELKSLPKQDKNLKQAAFIQYENKVNQEKRKMKSDFEFIEQSLNYINDILPTEAFIIMGNVVAPLKSEYLREKANELMFKYGGSNLQVTMLGKVTHKIEEISMPDLTKDPFFEFPKILSAVLSPLGVINEGDLIISPVAIYFE
jgi:hypothetical protein